MPCLALQHDGIEIRKLNHLKSDQLRTGQVIRIRSAKVATGA